ncbi:hypothetical protein MT488_23825 (plasmid) [Enterobacter ludwigii]|uniref:hypothetical protein n=1 Tax=Enterobacter TaxID=547 RepID=UPI0004DB4914|nr:MULTISPECIES: hypothetical protein [Enterobacter]KFA84258.1 hypothetical protein N037_22580 [Enterobacter sp. EGD-HP1]MEB8258316.1 hypothetical protein [Enterobacter asburiae]TYD01412.1 hypothetical protein E4M14_022480 [Enterobacter sp. Z1]UOH53804.1 hypothetical protein MT488_23825 [Enterobacter ludwigii]USX34090.1 hypothetical protein NHG68_26335 [Enterobacter sp. Z1]
MTKTLFTLIRDAGRAALYSFVLGPALMLYVFVMLAASDGSLSRQFLTTFHHLTEGAPAGKVMGCVNENVAGSFSPPEPGESLKPVPPALAKAPPEVLCQRGPVDSDSWARATDATLLNTWIISVMFGFGVWFVFRGLNLAARKKMSPDLHSVLARQNKETHE